MDYIKLSKEISYALRHKPEEYNLSLDEEGYVFINDLLNSKSCTPSPIFHKVIELVERMAHIIESVICPAGVDEP